jgi:hypothetical protein
MVEPQLEGDNDAYLVFTTSWARPNASFSFFLQLLLFPYSIGFLPMEANLDFRHLPCGGWEGGLSSQLPSCAMSKITLGHNPKDWCALAPVWSA